MQLHQMAFFLSANACKTISGMLQAHPPFVVRHLPSLLPYLKADSGLGSVREGTICLHISDMLSAASAVVGFSLGAK